MTEPFFESNEELKRVIYIRKRASSQIFHSALNSQWSKIQKFFHLIYFYFDVYIKDWNVPK